MEPERHVPFPLRLVSRLAPISEAGESLNIEPPHARASSFLPCVAVLGVSGSEKRQWAMDRRTDRRHTVRQPIPPSDPPY